MSTSTDFAVFRKVAGIKITELRARAEKAEAERDRLRAEVERWQAEAAEMSAQRSHNANQAGRLRAEVQRLNALGSWAHTCIHHTDEQRAKAKGCPVCATIERDQLRSEVERLKNRIKDDNRSYGCELRDPNGTIWEQASKDHARAERAEAALAEAKAERETVAEGSLRSLESYIDKLKQFAARAERAEAECLEQARLLGMSGEREADLLGKIERLQRIIERASVQFFHEGTDGETAAKMLNVLNESK